MATDEYAMEVDCVAVLIQIIEQRGKEVALTVWEQAEADAMAAGAKGISAAQMRQSWAEYEAQE